MTSEALSEHLTLSAELCFLSLQQAASRAVPGATPQKNNLSADTNSHEQEHTVMDGTHTHPHTPTHTHTHNLLSFFFFLPSLGKC